MTLIGIDIKKLSSLLIGSLLLSSLLLFSGCRNGALNICPSPPCAPQPPMSLTCQGATSVLETPYYRFEKIAPEAVSLGSSYEYIYHIMPRTDLGNIVVHDVIPEGATLVSTMPEAEIIDETFYEWKVPTLHAGQPVTMRAKVRANENMLLQNCALIEAKPMLCSCVAVKEPALVVTKCGPKSACVGEMVTFDVTVTNTGTFPAQNIVLTDIIPEELVHETGQREIEHPIGTLMPGQTYCAHICLQAVSPGESCNNILVKSDNTPEQEAQACLIIVEPSLEITKTGPERQYVERNATYEISVKNSGGMDLCDISVTDFLPQGIEFISASNGGYCDGRTVSWNIPMLRAGETKNFRIVLMNCCPGECCNEVTACVEVCGSNLNVSDKTCTLWEGHPIIRLEANKNCESICCGEQVCFTIRATNVGTAMDSNITIEAELSEELKPTYINGPTPYSISNNTVIFEPLSNLGPEQSIEYNISAIAGGTGTGVLNATLTSDNMASPLQVRQNVEVY